MYNWIQITENRSICFVNWIFFTSMKLIWCSIIKMNFPEFYFHCGTLVKPYFILHKAKCIIWSELFNDLCSKINVNKKTVERENTQNATKNDTWHCIRSECYKMHRRSENYRFISITNESNNEIYVSFSIILPFIYHANIISVISSSIIFATGFDFAYARASVCVCCMKYVIAVILHTTLTFAVSMKFQFWDNNTKYYTQKARNKEREKKDCHLPSDAPAIFG